MDGVEKTIVGIGVVFLVGLVMIATESYSRDKEIATQCEYLGSRVEGGFGHTTVYRWDCDGYIEETTIGPGTFNE